MSDMYGAVKSNIFRVKDADKFRVWFNEHVKFGDEIELFAGEVENTFSFGGYEQYPNAWPRIPAGMDADDPEEVEWGAAAFAAAIRKHLAKGQTFQVVAAGHEKLRYCGAAAFIVPPTGEPLYVTLYSDDPALLTNLRNVVKS